MYGNKQFVEDMEYISNAEFIPWDKLKNKTIFVTGATGLIGYTLVNSLAYANKKCELNLKILALVRDLTRAKERFKDIDGDPALSYVLGTVENLPEITDKIDYIVHGASITSSRAFVENPVEVSHVASHGTENLLKLAKEKHIIRMVYLSSMEVYGYPPKGHIVKENEIGTLSPLVIRNSYPIGKIFCESLCCAYSAEYNVPVSILRRTQTFGPGVDYKDGRIFAELMRCVIEKQDIILRTQGLTERSYLYTADAATAILTVLLKGKPGQAYTAANPSTYCSIVDMAKMVAVQLGEGNISVRVESKDDSNKMWTNTLYMQLDVSQLNLLGWKPAFSLEDMYKRMIEGVILQYDDNSGNAVD